MVMTRLTALVLLAVGRASAVARSGRLAGVARRTIHVDLGRGLAVGVVEVSDWEWWDSQPAEANPFGAKLWPAAVAVARDLVALPSGTLQGMTVLELGCGNGLCSLAAAMAGAGSVVASDLSVDALALVGEAADNAQLSVDLRVLDLSNTTDPLPPAELVIAADLMYDDDLARHVAVRVAEAARRGSWVIVADPKRGPREAFLRKLAECGEKHAFSERQTVRLDALKWKEKKVEVMHINRPASAATRTCALLSDELGDEELPPEIEVGAGGGPY